MPLFHCRRDIFEVLLFVVENTVVMTTHNTKCVMVTSSLFGKQSLPLLLIINTNLWSDTKTFILLISPCIKDRKP